MESFSTLLHAASEWPEVHYSILLLSIILLAGIGTAILFIISAIAFLRRQTSQYLLIMTALSALVLQSLIGAGTVLGIVPMILHHLIEHSLDFLIAALILYAVYRSGPGNYRQFTYSERAPEEEHESTDLQ